MPYGIDQFLAAQNQLQQAQQQSQQQAQPAPAQNAPPPASDPRADFIKSYIAAARANTSSGRLAQRGLWNMITGKDTDAAEKSAAVNAPLAYDQIQQADAKTQSDQLGLAQTFQLLRSLGVTGINPNNIPASYTGGQPAAPQPMSPSAMTPNAPQGSQLMAPQSTAPQTQPMAPQAASAPMNDIAARRAMFLRLGNAMSRFPAFAQQGAAFMKMAQDGLPDNTLPNSSGGVSDAVTGAPINMGAQEYNARGAGLKSAAEEAPRVQGTLITQGNQAGLDRETTREANFDKNRYDTVDGFDKTNGQPVSISRTALANGQAPNFVAGKNPYFEGQQAELKDLRTSADSADNGLNLASQLVSAANGLYTGKGSASLQNARKLAQSAAALTGTKLPDSINNDTSKFEQLQFASQQLVAAASHDLSPRVAQQIYNQIAAVKPGDKSSIQGLRDIITNQIVPTLARRKAMYGATSKYYQNNPTRNDAGAVVPDQMPVSKFAVKTDLNNVKPGDYFINPTTGDLQQRPVQ